MVVELPGVLLKAPLCLLAERVACKGSKQTKAGQCKGLNKGLNVNRWFRGVFALVTDVTVVEPDSVSVIFAVALHGVVGEVAFRHFLVRIDDNLKGSETCKEHKEQIKHNK